MAGMMEMMWKVTVIDVEKCLTAVCNMVPNTPPRTMPGTVSLWHRATG